MAASDRLFFQRRALQEIESAMRADCIEAEKSHVGLADLHIERCASCVATRSQECEGCRLANVCEQHAANRTLVV